MFNEMCHKHCVSFGWEGDFTPVKLKFVAILHRCALESTG